ncbi:MAG: hypothetical protein HYV97_04800 [Bdellovibrio sp.]|nr:hypothetical protein [Bdellovibrio sp.]
MRFSNLVKIHTINDFVKGDEIIGVCTPQTHQKTLVDEKELLTSCMTEFVYFFGLFAII